MESGLISVDRWTAGSQAYFLTHLHYDHTAGLSPAWAHGPLFCSAITADLLPYKFPGFRLSLLRVLEIGSWHSLSLVSPSSGSRTAVEVMAIDALHCPGSVMYLFRGEFGYVLYTGDFRWETTNEMAKAGRTMLLNALEGNMVETLYLDNTYCNPSFSFPPREVAAQQVVDIITSHPDHEIIIGIDSLGKEELLIQIAATLNIKIWVWPERLHTLHLLGFHDIFTTNTSLTRVRAVPRYSFSIDTLEGLNTIRCPTIGIMPSGLPWVVRPTERNGTIFDTLSTAPCRGKHCKAAGPLTDKTTHGGSIKPVERIHQYIYTVPYSDHSCFNELQDFVKHLRPADVKGIVSSSSCYVNPFYYLGHLCGGKQPLQGSNLKSGKMKGCIGAKSEQSKSSAMYEELTEAEKRHQMSKRINYLGVRMKRVSVLRRSRRGVKISVDDSR